MNSDVIINRLESYNESCNKIIGNKAVNILKMKNCGANIPDTWIIDNQYVMNFLNSKGLYNKGVEIDSFETVRKILLSKEWGIEFRKKLFSDLNIIFSLVRKKHFVVRSSSCLEDSSIYSFAGMFTSILNVRYRNNVVDAIVKVILDGFSDRIRTMCKMHGIFKVEPCAVIIQTLIDSKIGGVSFREDGYVTCNTAMGLTKGIVDGVSNTDKWVLNTQMNICTKQIEKKKKCILPAFTRSDPNCGEMLLKKADNQNYYFKCIDIDDYGGILTAEIPKELQDSQIISDLEIKDTIEKINRVAEYLSISNYDSEWCIDSNNVLFLLQLRSITKPINFINKDPKNHAIPIVSGRAVGRTCIIKDKRDLEDFQEGDILVTDIINGEAIHVVLKAAGCIIVTSSALSHSAIIAREIGLPCIGIDNVNEIPNYSYIEINGDDGFYKLLDAAVEENINCTSIEHQYEYTVDRALEEQLLFMPDEWKGLSKCL